jgi:CBS domain-containing protein
MQSPTTMHTAGTLCRRHVVTARREDSLLHAAALMRDEHVGDVVVIDELNGARVPVGVLTDRDIVVGVLARNGQYLERLTVGDVLTRPPVTATEREDIHDVVKRMRKAGVRRVPVVDSYGALVGVVAIDDVLELLSDTLQDISALGPRQRRREHHERK